MQYIYGQRRYKKANAKCWKNEDIRSRSYRGKEGKGTLKEAVDAAFNYLLENQDVFYLVGSCVGPSPYPEMVKYFQKL